MAKQRTPTLQVYVIQRTGICDICKKNELNAPIFELFLRAQNRNDSNSVIDVHMDCVVKALQKASREFAAVNKTQGTPRSGDVVVIDKVLAAFEEGGDSEDR